MHRLLTVFAAVFVVAWPSGAQPQFERRATMVGGGSFDRGKCTIEVVVDGIAEVEIRGDQGIIRNIAGQPAQWRRFQCSAPLPRNPAEFRFQGIDGRGRQQLLRDPRDGGAAIVRIEDPQSGSEGYTFDLIWTGGNGPVIGNRPPDRLPEPAPRRFTIEQAVGVCQDSVRNQAGDRFRGRRVEFLNTRIDDNPGRNDWVIGTIEVFRDRNMSEGRYQFSCSVNFDNGQVRSVQIDPMVGGDRRDPDRAPRRFTIEQAVSVCQDSVRRLAGDRFRDRRVEFLNTRIDDNPGRNDWVVGTIDVFRGRDFSEGRYRFSCSVNFDNGQVRSAEIEPRRM
jgi:hypothetical protein